MSTKNAIFLKRCKIGPWLLWRTNGKSHAHFRLVLTSMTLDDLERPKRHSCRNEIVSEAHHKNFNEDRPMLSAATCRPLIQCEFKFQLLEYHWCEATMTSHVTSLQYQGFAISQRKAKWRHCYSDWHKSSCCKPATRHHQLQTSSWLMRHYTVAYSGAAHPHTSKHQRQANGQHN